MYFLIRFVENIIYPVRVIQNYFSRLASLGGRRPGLSLAGKISFAFFFCFFMLITAAAVFHWWTGKPQEHPYPFQWAVFNFPIYYLIAIFCTIGVYWGIRLATLEKPSLYPEIDQCWLAMDEWRTEKNLAWSDFRRFLVVGPDLEISKAMHADMKGRALGPLPSGPNEWMHWFGTEQNLYVHLKKVCRLGSTVEQSSTGKKGGGMVAQSHTLQASEGVPEWSAEGFADTMNVSQDPAFGESLSSFGGSLDPAESLDPYASGDSPKSSDEAKNGSKQSSDKDESSDVLGDDGDKPEERLRYLCDLVLQKTQGEVPFHGVVVVIPFERFNRPENYKTITEAVKNDLLEIRKQTDVSFPVLFTFCSMEKDLGFPKLQSLMGAQRSATGRFGSGSKVNDMPALTMGNLELQVNRVCRSFETWVFDRWKKSSQISRAAQNKELFKLVARVRNEFQPRLQHLLEGSLVWSASEAGPVQESDLLVAGCYFVSTGSSSADRGFLTGVFSKCEEFAEASGWGDSILARDRRYEILGTLLFTVSFLAILSIVGYAIWKAYNP